MNQAINQSSGSIDQSIKQEINHTTQTLNQSINRRFFHMLMRQKITWYERISACTAIVSRTIFSTDVERLESPPCFTPIASPADPLRQAAEIFIPNLDTEKKRHLREKMIKWRTLDCPKLPKLHWPCGPVLGLLSILQTFSPCRANWRGETSPAVEEMPPG